MNLRNCSKCGKMFNYVGGMPVCLKCREAAEEEFQKVKAFVRENPGHSINQVAEACEVSTKQIQQWVREERLMFSSGDGSGIYCEKCGGAIQTGRFCDKCKASMTTGLQQTANSMRPKEEPKMPERKRDEHAGMKYLK